MVFREKDEWIAAYMSTAYRKVMENCLLCVWIDV